jgi:hypothetical protein
MQQVKRCALPYDEIDGDATIAKTVASLTTAVPIPELLMEEKNECELRVIAREIVADLRFPSFWKWKVYAPSTRGHFTYNRLQDGCVGFVRDKLVTICDHLSSPSLLGYTGFGATIKPQYYNEAVYDRYVEYVKKLLLTPLPQCRAEPVAVYEPFKVRVITKGDEENQLVARQFERNLGPRLRRAWLDHEWRNPFALCGGAPIEETVGHLGKAAAANQFEAALSGDYSAATDNLLSPLSEMILDEIVRSCNIPPETHSTLLNTLTRHVLSWSGGDKPAQQVRGQLMGSPISFIILSIANAVITVSSYRKWLGRRASWKSLPFLVNGDDLLAMHTELIPGFSKIWEREARLVGLESSVGKTYDSDRFCVINSQLFTRIGTYDWRFQPVARLNLTYGITRVVTVTKQMKDFYCADNRTTKFDDPTPLGQQAHELVELQTPAVAEFLMGKFIERRRPVLDRFRGRSWFLPVDAGGFGLPNLRDSVPSRLAIVVAGLLQRSEKLRNLYAHIITREHVGGQPAPVRRATTDEAGQRGRMSEVPYWHLKTMRTPSLETNMRVWERLFLAAQIAMKNIGPELLTLPPPTNYITYSCDMVPQLALF